MAMEARPMKNRTLNIAGAVAATGVLLFSAFANARPISLAIDPSAAQANAGLTDLYRSRTSELLQWLKKSGVEQISCQIEGQNCLSPDELLKILDETNIVTTSQFQKSKEATRFSAFYDPENKRLLLNELGYQNPHTVGFLGLHELLGIAGRPEEEYQHSLAAFVFLSHANLKERVVQSELNGVILQTEEQKRRLDERLSTFPELLKTDYTNWRSETSVGEANRQLEQASGGGTLVGGGGDGLSFEARLFVLYYLYDEVFRSSDVWIKKILSVPIEISKSAGSKVIYQGFSTRSPDPKDLILVPSGLVGVDAKPLAQEIGWFYSSLWPEHSSLKSDLVLKNCSGKKQLAPKNYRSFHPEAVRLYWIPLCSQADDRGQ